jgi:plasmid stability protein
MTNVQIKNVPAETHAVLKRRAAESHQSLQEYLRSRLIEEASRPTLEEVLDRAGSREGSALSLSTVVEVLQEDRARH